MVRVSKFFSGASEGKFLSTLYDDVKTLYDAFRKGAKESSEYIINPKGDSIAPVPNESLKF